MSFADTYTHEVLQSRRDRSRRAFFWARIVGLVLMITIGATLRADPELRAVLMRAGMDGVSKMANLQGGTQPQFARQLQTTQLQSAPFQTAPVGSQRPKPRIKINRPGSEPTTRPAPTPQETNALAQQLGRLLAARRAGN